jgi:hypothetical protein
MLNKSERGNTPFAMKRTCELLFHGEGRNLPGFMIGRQLLVVCSMFDVARITSLNVDVDAGDETIFGVPEGMLLFFNTGLLGAFITTIVGSITWQLVASVFPIVFLSNPLVYFFIRIRLLLKATGVCFGAWVLDNIHKAIAGFQVDEVYIRTADERAVSKSTQELKDQDHMGPGHPRKLPGFAEHAPPSLKKLRKSSDPRVAEYLQSMHAMENGEENGEN